MKNSGRVHGFQRLPVAPFSVTYGNTKMMHDQFFAAVGVRTNREDWQFQYQAHKVAAGAREQLKFRLGRVKVWEKQKADVIAKIRKGGLKLSESMSEQMSNATKYNTANSRGRAAAEFKVDESMQADLDECLSKIETHKELVASYQAWIQVLDSNPHANLSLKHGDWMFFFGKL